MAKSPQENPARMPDKEDTAHHFGLTMRPVTEREDGQPNNPLPPQKEESDE